mgnify:CR=1 FL=1
MTKRPPQDTENTTPKEFANVTPDVRELYPTSDIRFVMRDVGSLSSDVKALQKSVDQLDQNDRRLQNIINQIKGGLIVGGVIGGLALSFFVWMFGEKLDAIKYSLVSQPTQSQPITPQQTKP